ncbi:MAG: inositol monophosphatase [Bacillaceae bacterium]|nr:inositol monophosphatase [Bacillaceae bacterium]
MIRQARKTAVEAVRAAGQIARKKFGKAVQIQEKGDWGDLVTEVDHEAEQVILKRIHAHFPDHQVRSEETGWSGVESEWLWLVDPLDGTNNYTLGLPVYGVAITLLHRRKPVLGVIYDAHQDLVYIAEKGKGMTCNNQPIRLDTIRPLTNRERDPRRMTVGWIQGHQVQKESRAMALKQELDLRFKRVLRLWAPSLLWCMMARGDLDGIVLYNSEGDDLYAGVLMVEEAGGLVMDYRGNPFEGMNEEPYLIACRPEDRHLFLNLVQAVMLK